MRLIDRVLKHFPRDPASVNAIKQRCVIVMFKQHIETRDLNMDFRSFDNGLKQLYEYVSIQECTIALFCWSLHAHIY